MDAIVEARVRDYLRSKWHYSPYQCGAIVYCLRNLARMAGYDLDDRFASAGLGAGPEARIATGIVDLALGGGGCETSAYAIRQQIDQWLRTTSPHGMVA